MMAAMQRTAFRPAMITASVTPPVEAGHRMTPYQAVNPQRIKEAYRLIAPHIRRPPGMAGAGSDFGLADMALTLKLELHQHGGSFKARGAFANLLLRDVPASGVVAASGGNHGVAVAYAAHRLAVPARIFVPSPFAPAQ